MYLHIGEEIDGGHAMHRWTPEPEHRVMGEMEDECYPHSNHLCNFFDFYTFGGHIKVRQIYLARARSTQPGEDSHNAILGQGCLAGKGLGGKGRIKRGETSGSRE